MLDDQKTGLLLNSNTIKIQRQYFREMVKLIGVTVLYRSPKPDKHWSTYADIESNYNTPLKIGCIFNEHPKQQTLKKIGWVSELQESSSLISVDYDLPELQQGALFILPSGIDNAPGRIFRVIKIYNEMIYPSSITCEIVPEYEDEYLPETSEDYTLSSFTLINEEDD